MTGIALGLAVLLGAAAGWAGVVLTIGLVAVALVIDRQHWALCLLLTVCAMVGCLRVYGADEPSIRPWGVDAETITGFVVSGPIETGSAQRFDLRGKPDAAQTGDEQARLCISGPLAPRTGYGDTVQITGNVHWLDELNPEMSGYLRSRGCSGSVFTELLTIVEDGTGPRAWLDRHRRDLVAEIQRVSPGDTGALLAGLVTGDDAALSSDTRDAFIVTGTSHVTAVSGSMIVTMLTMVGMAAGVARRWPWQLLILAALWGYVGLIGPSPPPIRAAGVATLAVIAVHTGRKPDFITLSVIIAALEILWRPGDFASLAFRLSTVSSIALVLGLGGMLPSGWRGWLRHGIVATAVTQVATSALLVPVFGRSSLYAVPANLLIGPLCAVAFALGFMGGFAGMAVPLVGAVFGTIAAIPAWMAIEVATLFTKLPGATASPALVRDLPLTLLAVAALVGVAAMSQECRGGIRRTARAFSGLDARSKCVITGATVGAVIGALPGLLLR